MLPRLRTMLRLLSLQSSYTYERLQGIGIAVAQEPLLEPLAADPPRAREARSRSAQYFNAHPFLASIAVGALSRAELDGEDGNRIVRLRTALSGPLGSLGDQLFWAGVVPALMGIALVASSLGRGLETLVAIVIGYNLFRVVIMIWGLRVGFAHGLKVAGELSQSRLVELAALAGTVAAWVIGVAIPWIAKWQLRGAGQSTRSVIVLVGVAFVIGVLTRHRPLPVPMLTLGVGAMTVIWRWSFS